MTSVLLLGATGFLGGTVLTQLEEAGYQITSLVRPGKEDKLSSRKTKVEIGDFSELSKIERLSSQHDAVINAATSDDLDLTKAINKGLAAGRKDGRKGVLVHISGTQLIESSGGSGNYEDVPLYDDSDLGQIKGISDKALHRYIDLEVERSDLAGEIIGSIICPGLIYGVGTGPVKVVSDLNPDFVRKALKANQVVYAGDGHNEWADVHVKDVANLIHLSLEHNLKATEPAGFERFYFAENGKHQKLPHAHSIARIMHAENLIPTAEPRSVPADSKEAPGWANRTTCRCVGNRARKDLGWAPAYKMADTLEEDVMATAKEGGK